MKEKIFISASTFGKYGDEPLKLLQDNSFNYITNPLGRRLVQDEILEICNDCSGVLAGLEPFDDYVLNNMKNLRCISRCGVGIDNIDLLKAKERNIAIFNTPDVVIQPVAELAIAMIFDLIKRLTWQTTLMRLGRWEKKTGNLLKGKRVGILGLGKIGKRTAQILTKLDTEVYAADIFPDKDWAKSNGIKVVSYEELLKTSDILSIHLSFNKDNPFCLGQKEISLMKKGAILINVARGRFIDEDALYEALKRGYLAGAAFDVFSKEPYSGKLCELENVVLTPHIATLTQESRLEMEIQATKNLLKFFNV